MVRARGVYFCVLVDAPILSPCPLIALYTQLELPVLVKGVMSANVLISKV